MIGFSIDITIPAPTPEGPCGIRIRAGEVVFTRLLREPHNQPDDSLLAAPSPLAFWLCDNWWRLRWEGIPSGGMTADWRLAHDLTAVGAGYAWPRLCLWGDSDRIGLLSQSDPVGVVGPVRYLTDALLSVGSATFEAAVDAFLDRVADAQRGYGSDRPALCALVAALRAERTDPEVARWRRLEARLGYDPDGGPDGLIQSAGALADRFGLEGVEEACSAAPGIHAPEVLEQAVTLARERGAECDFSALVSAIAPLAIDPGQPPWIAAEAAAGCVRTMAGIGPGPLRNRRLAELLGVSPGVFRDTAAPAVPAFGLRLGGPGQAHRQRVALHSRWPQGRRFELCRALGDALWARDAPLGPLARTGTARQRFQRAFAQGLLCPFEDLTEFLNTQSPDDEDLAAAARHFHVAEIAIRTVLINKGVLPRERMADGLEAA